MPSAINCTPPRNRITDITSAACDGIAEQQGLAIQVANPNAIVAVPSPT